MSKHTPLSKRILERFAEKLSHLLHPSLYKATFQEAGAELGREALKLAVPEPRASALTPEQAYLQFSEWIKVQWGWDHSMAAMNRHAFEARCPTCQFETLACESSDICQAEAACLGAPAGELFGYSKVILRRDHGDPPRNCRFLVYTEPTSHCLAEEGLTFRPHHDGERHKSSEDARRILDRLSPRERQIIGLLAQGLSDKQIASTLRLSVRTVEGHLARIREKTALGTRSALIRFAIETTDSSRMTFPELGGQLP